MRRLRRTPQRQLLISVVMRHRRVLFHRQVRVAFVKDNALAVRKEAASALLELKRSAKISWDKLGLTADESLFVASVSQMTDEKPGKEKRAKALLMISEMKSANATRAAILESLQSGLSITKANAAYYYDRVAPK